ncbi:MAG: AAA family ATPase [Gemmataceae bacterium]|nr:AAA family ATPase [Gemmataceae bacterium]
MAKKKSDAPESPLAVPAAPALQPPAMMPQGMPAMMPGMAMPGMQQPNPMLAMMQMMQMMMSGGGMAPTVVDPAALPFTGAAAVQDGDKGLDADIIRPALLTNRLKSQQAVKLGSVLDCMCLSDDRQHALGGVPKGCTIALAGPPGKGKTRSVLAGLSRVASAGNPVGFVIAEEGFHNDVEAGRDDLCSRLIKIGMAATGLSEAQFTKDVLENVYVLESQYHKGQTWDDFVTKYRYLVEKEKIRFVVIDSLNMLDPTKNRTADNLSALKTYNHEKGITCVCVGQIRDTGMPVGGEALMHTADAVFLIEEMSLGSKEIADFWGGKYREKIDVINAVKSVTTPVLPYPVRIERDPSTGVMVPHPAQPKDYPILPEKG